MPRVCSPRLCPVATVATVARVRRYYPPSPPIREQIAQLHPERLGDLANVAARKALEQSAALLCLGNAQRIVAVVMRRNRALRRPLAGVSAVFYFGELIEDARHNGRGWCSHCSTPSVTSASAAIQPKCADSSMASAARAWCALPLSAATAARSSASSAALSTRRCARAMLRTEGVDLVRSACTAMRRGLPFARVEGARAGERPLPFLGQFISSNLRAL